MTKLVKLKRIPVNFGISHEVEAPTKHVLQRHKKRNPRKAAKKAPKINPHLLLAASDAEADSVADGSVGPINVVTRTNIIAATILARKKNTPNK